MGMKGPHPPVFSLLGRGGAGKTESSAQIAKITGLPVIELGAFIRKKYVESDALAFDVINNFMRKGKYFPGEYSIIFIRRAIAENPSLHKNGFIIDGFPRRIQDLKAFERFVVDQGYRLGGVIELKIPSQVSQRRQQQRKRETDDVIRSREKEFQENEQRVINAFRKFGLVQTIDMRVRGRKNRRPQKSMAYELAQTRFLKSKARQIAKAIRRLRH